MSNDEQWWREELGRALAVLRTVCGVNQDDLARVTGILGSSLSDYERGRVVPGLKMLQRLLGGLGLPLVSIQEAQGLIESVTRQRLGAFQKPRAGAGADEANLPSFSGLDGQALRREIDRVAGATGKDVGQLIRLTLLLLCQLGEAPDVRAADPSTDHREAALELGPAGASRGEGPGGPAK